MQKTKTHSDSIKTPREVETTYYGHIDLPFLLLLFLISVIGLIMMFSASYATAIQYDKPPSYYLTRQSLFYGLGLLALIGLTYLPYHFHKIIALPAFLSVTVLLALVLIAGTRINGGRRWFSIFGIEIQPSELAKITIIIVFATLIVVFGRRMERFKYGVLPFGAVLLLYCGLVIIEPHLSGAIIIGVTGLIMMFVGGVKKRWFAILLSVGAAAATAAYYFMPHVQRRIAVWQNPELDRQGAGWQAYQSLLAIGPGGPFGRGLGQSIQKFSSLPERHNDYVFAIVCEEIGFFGALLIITLFVLLICRGFWIALQTRDRFGSLLVCGFISLLAVQTFLNIGVVTTILPPTGVSLPFFSYGGTALIVQMASMGIILNVSKYIPAKKAG